MKLCTERLVLREYIHSDFTEVHEYASDPETVLYMLWGPNNKQDTLNFLNRAIKYQTDNPRKVSELAVELKESGCLIGGCSIYITNEANKEGELGYCFSKKYWNNGYATEAAQAIMKFGFHTLNLHRIYATCDPSNIGSARVMEKAGMRREGRLREHLLQRGRWRDSYLYSILEYEFS